MKPLTLTEATLRCRQLLAANHDPGNTLEGLLDDATCCAVQRLVALAEEHAGPTLARARPQARGVTGASDRLTFDDVTRPRYKSNCAGATARAPVRAWNAGGTAASPQEER